MIHRRTNRGETERCPGRRRPRITRKPSETRSAPPLSAGFRCTRSQSRASIHVARCLSNAFFALPKDSKWLRWQAPRYAAITENYMKAPTAGFCGHRHHFFPGVGRHAFHISGVSKTSMTPCGVAENAGFEGRFEQNAPPWTISSQSSRAHEGGPSSHSQARPSRFANTVESACSPATFAL